MITGKALIQHRMCMFIPKRSQHFTQTQDKKTGTLLCPPKETRRLNPRSNRYVIDAALMPLSATSASCKNQKFRDAPTMSVRGDAGL